jgi:hypothetical protein
MAEAKEANITATKKGLAQRSTSSAMAGLETEALSISDTICA